MSTIINQIFYSMSEFFDQSPREPKRRRTTYNNSRSVLANDHQDAAIVTGEGVNTEEHDIDKSASMNEIDDSAYGSKEDSLVDEDGFPMSSSTAQSQATQTRSHRNKTAYVTKKTSNESRLRPETKARHIEVAETEDCTTTDNDPVGKTKTTEIAQTTSDRETTPVDVAVGSELADEAVSVQPRSSGRERKRPRRFSISPEKPKARKSSPVRATAPKEEKQKSGRKARDSAQELRPKGILTPSRRGRPPGSRKSVVFHNDEEDIGEQLGFKDIDTSREKRKQAKEVEPFPNSPTVQAEIPITPVKRTISESRKRSSSHTLQRNELEAEPQYEDLLLEGLIGQDVFSEIVQTVDPTLDATFDVDIDPGDLTIKSKILARLVCRGPRTIPPHLQPQYDCLRSLLRATITSGESNSLLLLGARGSGKSHLLETAVSELASEHAEDFYTVRLDGFYQTDDRLALREIWRQLGREMQVDEMATGEFGGSYADTMASLLSLLSHSDDFADSGIGTSDNMQLDSGLVRTSRSIVFILDEFDLFTTHPRQTLLYNLFDIAQSRKAPIAVIGCSTRMDAVECLEKRVKSRFSHRWLHIPSAKTLHEYEDIVKNVLCLQDCDSTKELQWNQFIQDSFLKSPNIRGLIHQSYYTTKLLPDLLSALYIPIATAKVPVEMDEGIDISSTIVLPNTTSAPSTLTLLSQLPTLQLALLTAASRLDTIHNLTTVNFNLVHAHYVELISQSKLQITASGAMAVGASLKQWSRETAQSAWEDLAIYELITPVSGSGVGAGSKDNICSESAGSENASVRMWRVDATLEEISWAVKEKWSNSGGSRDVLVKWCREI